MDTKILMKLREQTGAPITACRQILIDTQGDFEKALELLKKKGLEAVEGKTSREASEGLVDSYIHPNGRVGSMVEVNCETDFVARTEDFRELAHNLAMQVAAADPLYVSEADVPSEVTEKQKEMFLEELQGQEKPPKIVETILKGKLEKWFEDVCLLNQPFIKDEDVTIGDLVKEKIAKFGENVKVKRFARFSF